MPIAQFGLLFANMTSTVTIYISIHPLNRLYLKAIQEMLKIKNDWI